MKTLVTGLDGFTGNYLKDELEKHDHIVIGLSSDLTDVDAVEAEIKRVQPEMVVHLAGISFVGHGNANKFYEVNLIGTRNLLAALAEHAPNIQSVLIVSSANVYGNSVDSVLQENMPLNPANDYAISKLAMEQMSNLWVDQLPLFIVRPFNYTGVGQNDKFLIPKVVSHFKKKKEFIELGNLDIWREFGDVRSVVEIYRKLLDKCPVGETLNICTGQAYSLREIIKLCEKITNHSIEIKVNPKFVRDNEVRVLKGDNSKLKNFICDWKTNNLEQTLYWMLNNNE